MSKRQTFQGRSRRMAFIRAARNTVALEDSRLDDRLLGKPRLLIRPSGVDLVRSTMNVDCWIAKNILNRKRHLH